MKTVVAVLLLLSAGVSLAYADESTRAHPNIVILLADDMGFSDIGCYGGEISTPNIDALAAEGVRFTQFYNAGRCCPSRAALLTGLYPHQAELGWMTSKGNDSPGYYDDLSRNALTIAEVLRAANYSTYMAGKWHVSKETTPTGENPNWPIHRGFDRYYGTHTGGAGYFDPNPLIRGDRVMTKDQDTEYQPKDFYYTTAIADQASRFIREHVQEKSDRPFFMYVAFTAPHWPLQAPAGAVAKYHGKYDAGYEPIRAKRFAREKELGIIAADSELSPPPDQWDAQPDRAREARCMEVYAAQVELMDEGVGRVIAALKETGKLDNTLVLFLSDNGGCAEKMGRQSTTKPAHPTKTRDGRPIHDGAGTMPGPDDTFMAYGRSWANVSNTPFRLYKKWVHEGGISTPLIAHWPAMIKRHNELERQPGHIIDLMTTCMDVSGASYPARINNRAATPPQGVSLVPAFLGQPLSRTTPLFWEHEGNRAIRVGNYKLVAKGETGPWELYDITKDRAELHNLADKEPARVKDLSTQWQHWAEANNVFPLNPFKNAQQE
ncbi:MAG TPA: arylsulfatase [Tepidisphaeraceae bacterium]|jgi:arylsulfatase|nr:arylsulfatase [Tepidisphaeraceae bacterium]